MFDWVALATVEYQMQLEMAWLQSWCGRRSFNLNARAWYSGACPIPAPSRTVKAGQIFCTIEAHSVLSAVPSDSQRKFDRSAHCPTQLRCNQIWCLRNEIMLHIDRVLSTKTTTNGVSVFELGGGDILACNISGRMNVYSTASQHVVCEVRSKRWMLLWIPTDDI